MCDHASHFHRRIDRPSPKRSASIAPFPISVRCLSNATIIANVFMAASALLTAPNTLLSAAPDVTALLVPATAVPAGLAAASTSSATPGRCAPGLPFDFGGRPPRREPHRSGSHLHGLAHRSPSQTGPISYQILPPSIRNSTFLRRPSTITSIPVSSAKLPGSPPSTCAVRSAGSSPKRRPRSIRKERTGAICEAGPIRTIWPISHNTRMSSSFRWIRSITMDRTALSFRPLNSSGPAFSLPSIMKKRPLPP